MLNLVSKVVLFGAKVVIGTSLAIVCGKVLEPIGDKILEKTGAYDSMDAMVEKMVEREIKKQKT